MSCVLLTNNYAAFAYFLTHAGMYGRELWNAGLAKNGI